MAAALLLKLLTWQNYTWIGDTDQGWGIRMGWECRRGVLEEPPPLLRPLQILPPVALIICAPPCPPQPAAVHLDLVCCLALGTPRSIFSRQSASVRLNSRVEPSLLPHLPRDPTSEKRRRKWRRLSGTRSPVRAGTSTNRGRRQQVGKR